MFHISMMEFICDKEIKKSTKLLPLINVTAVKFIFEQHKVINQTLF